MAEIITVKDKMIRSARDLEVFKRAYIWSLHLHKISLTFPQIEQYDLAKQLRRSSKSVCANIVEGFSKQSQSKLDFKRFLTIALGSADETSLWLDYARDLNYISIADIEKINAETESIIAMLVKFRNNVK